MINQIGNASMIIWFAVCIWFVLRTETFLKAWIVGFVTSWFGMTAIAFIVGAFMAAKGGMGLHGVFAILTGWIPCLVGSLTIAAIKTFLGRRLMCNQDQKIKSMANKEADPTGSA